MVIFLHQFPIGPFSSVATRQAISVKNEKNKVMLCKCVNQALLFLSEAGILLAQITKQKEETDGRPDRPSFSSILSTML